MDAKDVRANNSLRENPMTPEFLNLLQRDQLKKNASRVKKPNLSQRGEHLKEFGGNFIYNKAIIYLNQNKSLRRV